MNRISDVVPRAGRSTSGSRALAGLAAGAAGTSALNVVTYLDMVLRGRPSSSTPADAASKLADLAGLDLGGDDAGENRASGLGALLGYLTGLGVGAVFALIGADGKRDNRQIGLAVLGVSAAAMVGSDAPLTALGLTDPRDWKPADWISDVLPHLAYGLVTVATYRLISRRERSLGRWAAAFGGR